MKRIQFGRWVKFSLLVAIALLFCIFTPPVLGAIQSSQDPPASSTPLMKATVYTDLKLDAEILHDPPQSSLRRGTLGPVPSLSRRVREDQTQHSPGSNDLGVHSSLMKEGREDQSPPILGDLGGSRASNLDQQARSLYANGRYREAAIAFQEAAQAYKTQGDAAQQAIALSNLALTYQQLGAWTEANGAIAQSLELLPQGALGQVLDIQGGLQLAQGQTQAALTSWEQAAAIYDSLGHVERATASRVNQAQALQTLGLYRRAIATLVTALNLDETTLNAADTLETLPVSATTAAALRSLGESLRVVGSLTQAEVVLQRSLAIAQELNDPEAIAAAQFNLGNVVYAKGLSALSLGGITPEEVANLIRENELGRRFRDTNNALAFNRQIDAALQLYQVAADSSTTRIQAQLNQLNLLVLMQRWTQARSLVPQLQSQIERLPPSRSNIYTRINFAQSLMTLEADQTALMAAAQLLSVAVQQAEDLQDVRSQSYALGVLGGVYEKTQQWENAERLTRRAALLSQAIEAPDIAYLWQWQLGRLLKARSQTSEAIAAYTEAVNTLKLIRGDLIAVSTEEQFLFKDTIEPIHRELVELLLSDEGAANADNLQTARQVIESLQLAELDNFFREACLTAKPEQIDQIDPSTAVLYPILLRDRLAVVVKLPNRELTYYATAIEAGVTPDRIETTVNQLRQYVQSGNVSASVYLPFAQQLYDWLIRPISPQLQTSSVKTLVFVLDGALRNAPMSALHDGNQFLIEQYSVALTPGLQLVEPRPLAQERLTALIAGLTEARASFSELENVGIEMEQISSQIRDNRVLLNQQFTNVNFQTALNAVPFPVVHLATHGKFSSRLQDTYILTWDSRLDINQLRNLLQATEIREGGSLELLVLSACETAAGDSRAALGLAGMAVRSGARSTVATLWQVGDRSTSVMMGQFYESLLQPGTTKATALQEAQLKLLHSADYQNPYFWAPYVLIGNWQ